RKLRILDPKLRISANDCDSVEDFVALHGPENGKRQRHDFLEYGDCVRSYAILCGKSDSKKFLRGGAIARAFHMFLLEQHASIPLRRSSTAVNSASGVWSFLGETAHPRALAVPPHPAVHWYL